jgi:hypothetical protein
VLLQPLIGGVLKIPKVLAVVRLIPTKEEKPPSPQLLFFIAQLPIAQLEHALFSLISRRLPASPQSIPMKVADKTLLLLLLLIVMLFTVQLEHVTAT